MATQQEIEATYDYMDELFRLLLGNHADITGAMYNGDFSMSLEQAQEAKHEYILRGIEFETGDRVLDIGCGWGPMLRAIHARHGEGVGLTLSPAQADACKKDGFEVYVQDWKTLDTNEVGTFDGIVSVGAFEHFCSIEESKQGKQDAIYDQFFALCSSLLPAGGKLFLQTMMWGKDVPSFDEIDVHAPKLSRGWILGHIEKFYPGSWLPNGLEHIVRSAEPYFTLISENNGRLDYIQTMNEWGHAMHRASRIKKMLLAARLIPRYAHNKNFRYQVTSLLHACNRKCFEQEIMSHQRMVFEKRS